MDAHFDPPPSASSPASSVGPLDERFDRKELHALLCSLSHELCRPLASLRTGFDLLIADGPAAVSPQQMGHVTTMIELCDELLHLTRSYLDYAEVVRGARTPVLGTFSIGAIVGEIDRQFGPIARGHGHSWKAVAVDPDARIVTDASRCQQIFGNLVANAIKYTPAGGAIAVTARVEGDSWNLTVDDDGPGVPADSLDRIFEPFFRLPRDEQAKIEGHGLGLSICRELAAQLHGRIVARSVVGRGTSMSVVLPGRPHDPKESPKPS
jgi:signal transduction histidine kinase